MKRTMLSFRTIIPCFRSLVTTGLLLAMGSGWQASITAQTEHEVGNQQTSMSSSETEPSNGLPFEGNSQIRSSSASENQSLESNDSVLASTSESEAENIGSQIDSLTELDWTSKENLPSTLRYLGLITVISLAPALFLMTTSYIRIIVVLSILRQAIGIGQTPSTQVLTALSLFMTILVMTPVWSEVYTESIKPYTEEESEMDWAEAFERGVRPIKRFMSRQIDFAENIDDIWMFYQYLPESERTSEPETFDDIPIRVMLPAFLISELKVAFLIGFSIFLPFLVLDLIVSSVSVSMGMVMLPPAMISLPLKLALFVLVDGWTLVVGMLLNSFIPYS